MVKPVMNLDEVEYDDVEENGRYTSSRGRISDHIGARDLGYNLTVLPPGKVQCPFHCHHGEEEMFLILEGEGELRFGDARYPLSRLGFRTLFGRGHVVTMWLARSQAELDATPSAEVVVARLRGPADAARLKAERDAAIVHHESYPLKVRHDMTKL